MVMTTLKGLLTRPETVDALIFEIKQKWNLASDFCLQFEDPEFNNALFSLVNMEDLPSSKATIKIVKLVELKLTSTDDTVLLSDSTNSPERQQRWPAIFVVLNFSYEVEHILRQGNSAFEREGTTITLTKDQKHNILEVMAAEMYKHKVYPSIPQIGLAAAALVEKHPCLKDKSERSKGYECWQNSLSFKMGNYRHKLSQAGTQDVAINAGKRSRTNPEGAPSRSSVKRPRRGEVNFLPNFPHGENKDILESQRLDMVEQFKRSSVERNMVLIHQQMQHTFALRREEIVKTAAPIDELNARWTVLFCEAQVSKKLTHTKN